MRKFGSSVVALVALMCCASSSGAPSISFSVEAEPVSGFPHTGNLAGAGAQLALTVQVSPAAGEANLPPLTHLALAVPPGMKVQTTRFPKCSESLLAAGGPGPSACPRGSQAGRRSSLTALVPSGSHLLPETLSAQPFFAAQGGVVVYLLGQRPTAIEALAPFDVTGEPAPSQVELTIPPHLVEGRPVLLTAVQLSLGAAMKVAHMPNYMVTMPRNCPAGALPYTLTATFGGQSLAPEQTVQAAAPAPCPRVGSGPAPPAKPPPCTSRRLVTVHIPRRRGVAYRRATARLNGRSIPVHRGRELTVAVDLAGLAKGTYVLRVALETTRGRHRLVSRTFHTCVAGAPPK